MISEKDLKNVKLLTQIKKGYEKELEGMFKLHENSITDEYGAEFLKELKDSMKGTPEQRLKKAKDLQNKFKNGSKTTNNK